MLYLKADTITEVTIGPAVAVGDGFTPVTNLVGSTADEFEIIKHGATTTTTIAGTLAAITGADGYYALDLSATDTNTEGRLVLLINDDSLILPIRHEFMVVNANVYDSLFAVAGTDLLDTQVAGMDADTVNASALATDAVDEIVDQVWEEAQADHIAVGSMGEIAVGVVATLTTLATIIDSIVLSSAVIETVTSQTQFVIPATDDATDDDVYNGSTAVFIDGTDPNQKSVRSVIDYDATSRTVTIDSAPDFVITTADTLTILSLASVKGVWDELLTGATHNIANSAGRRLRLLQDAGVVTDGMAQAGGPATITLESGESSTTDIFAGDRVIIVGGLGVGEHGIITAYDGGTKIATMSQNWVIQPDSTSEYELVPADVDVETWQHAVVSASATTNLPEVDAKSISDDATAADNLEASATVIVSSTSKAGTLTTTQMSTNLTEATDDHYIGRTVIWVDGVLAGQASDITDYVGTNGVLTYSTLTEAPGDGDAFVIV